jgi:cell division protein FtsZ
MPFSFEMSKRAQNALAGVKQLQPHTHTLITVPNDRLLQIVPRDLSLEIAFRLADDVLRQGVQGIAELITRPGMINVDFAHVRELMLRGGGAYMAIGLGKGEDKANAAVHQALHHPLLEMDSIDTASGVLVHFTGGEDLTLYEVGDAVTNLRQSLAPDADVILGATTEKSMNGRAQAILIFTGVGGRPVKSIPDEAGVLEAAPVEQVVGQNLDDLDLPTFLRRRVSTGAGS